MATKEVGTWRAVASAAGVSVSEFVRDRVNQSLMSVEKRTGVRPEGGSWREVFLAGLECGRSAAAASREAGVSRTLVYRERPRSREFAVAWELALEEAEDMLADSLHESALTPLPGRSSSIRYPAGTPPQRGGVRSRQSRLQLRLERSDAEAWQKAAAAAGVSLSGLVRRLVRGVVVNPGGLERRPGSWRPAFIAALRQSGHVTDACRIAGVSPHIAYSERARSPAFRFAWHMAKEVAADRIHALLWQHGVEGVLVVQRTVRTKKNRDGTGTETVTVTERRRHSRWALMELLRRRDPRYRF
jgi:hypothetical protein